MTSIILPPLVWPFLQSWSVVPKILYVKEWKKVSKSKMNAFKFVKRFPKNTNRNKQTNCYKNFAEL